MAEYQLTQRARADLIGIYDFTESKFDSYQADAYYASLIRSFELLADFPLIGQTVEDLAAGYRRFRFQSTLCKPIALKSARSFMVHKTSDRNSSI